MDNMTKVIKEEMEKLLEKSEKIISEKVKHKPEFEYLLRLIGVLRDIIKIHEMDKLSVSQAWEIRYVMRALQQYFIQSIPITRDEHRQYCKDLLAVDLTWLPVTEKAQKDIEEMKKELG